MSIKFSLVTVCRNSAAVLPRALASIRTQTYANREWVVIDGASTDESCEIVRTSQETLGSWISEPDKGIYDAMNKGWQRSVGDFVYFLNSDDALFDSEVLATVANVIDADPAADMVVAEAMYRFPDGSLVRRNYRHINSRSILFEDLCHQAVFVRRELFQRIGGFNESFRVNADYDWLIRVFRSGARVAWLDRPVSYFTTGGAHTANISSHLAERRAVRLQYVSPLLLKAGSLGARARHRLYRLLLSRKLGHFPVSKAGECQV